MKGQEDADGDRPEAGESTRAPDGTESTESTESTEQAAHAEPPEHDEAAASDRDERLSPAERARRAIRRSTAAEPAPGPAGRTRGARQAGTVRGEGGQGQGDSPADRARAGIRPLRTPGAAGASTATPTAAVEEPDSPPALGAPSAAESVTPEPVVPAPSTDDPAGPGSPSPAERARAALREARARDRAREAADPRHTAAAAPAGTVPQAPAAPAKSPAKPTARPVASPAAGGPRRTFPPGDPGSREGADQDGTVWSVAWERAVEELSGEPGRLARARQYEEGGQVAAVTVTPGQALAYVHGSRARPYRAVLRLPVLSEARWALLLDAVAARPDRLAALLEKELPAALLTAEGAALLPGPGEPATECGCPDPVRPCKHATALALRLGRLLAADPFVLLLLRGRGEAELVTELTRRHAHLAAQGGTEHATLPGVPAGEALARPLRPLPPPLPLPPRAEPPPPYPAAGGGPDPLALDQLATDAAARALAFLRTGEDPVAGLDLWQDAVRLAAARPGSGLTSSGRALYTTLAKAAGRGPTDLLRAVAAWRRGGAEALDVLEGEPWDPPAGPFDRARPLLMAAGHAPYRPWHNRLTQPEGRYQLRMDRDGTWYAYESEPGEEDWWPRGIPYRDPAAALDSARDHVPDELVDPDPDLGWDPGVDWEVAEGGAARRRT